MRGDLADGVAGQREVHQAGHVDKVLLADYGDEVVGEPQLHRLAVDGGRDEQQACLGAEQGERGGLVLADAAAGTAVAPR